MLPIRTLIAVACLAVLGPAARSQQDPDPYALPKDVKLSFTTDIKPILDTKCVACHACYDAPAQLDLRNAKGVQRGAIKLDPYFFREKPIESTVISHNPKSIEDWRKRGFFSVVEGGKDSLMGKMIDLAYKDQWPKNSKIPGDIVLDSLDRRVFAATLPEFDGYAKLHPKEGMPLAVSGLTPQEYAKLMKWLEDGAPFDEVAPQATEADKKKIAEWEAFLNADDLKSKLIARYVYEHHNLFHFCFDKSGGDSSKVNFFRLVRSSTPPGKDVVPIVTHFPNSPIDGPFYYRFSINDQTLTVKMHQLLLDATGDKLDRYKAIFADGEWNVAKLPGYTTAERVDPLKTFAGIPAKTRWKFLLEDCRLHRGSIVWGPVCRGNLLLSSVQEVEWDLFEDPETSLYCNDAEYRAELEPYLALADEPEDLVSLVVSAHDEIARYKQALKKAISRVKDGRGGRSRLQDIWRGDREGHTPVVVIYNHYDSAFVTAPGIAFGDFPKTAWLFDLPILERGMYQAVINFDLFGPVEVWIANRHGFGMTRRAAELNFLRFLPADKRQAIYDSWYVGKASRNVPAHALPSIDPDVTLPAEIAFKTDDPKREFLQMVLGHVQFTDTADPINRPRPGQNVELDRTGRSMRSIVAAAEDTGPQYRKFKTMLPEATFIRVDTPGKDPAVYTMTRDRDYMTKAFASSKLLYNDVAKDRVSILPGVVSAYPNFMFRVDENEVEEFAANLTDADTPEKFTAVVERWGVRRTNPDFWPILHSFTDYVRRTRPLEAAVFDINRYKNP